MDPVTAWSGDKHELELPQGRGYSFADSRPGKVRLHKSVQPRWFHYEPKILHMKLHDLFFAPLTSDLALSQSFFYMTPFLTLGMRLFFSISLLEWYSLHIALLCRDSQLRDFIESQKNLTLVIWTILKLLKLWRLLKLNWIHSTIWDDHESVEAKV